MTELAKKLKSVLTDTPQSRERLAYLCGCSDSQLRAAKKELVDSGICVCSNSHTTGYWMGNEKEIGTRSKKCSRDPTRLEEKP